LWFLHITQKKKKKKKNRRALVLKWRALGLKWRALDLKWKDRTFTGTKNNSECI
jgi:hypothetical protein